jgi:hypothetical protein
MGAVLIPSAALAALATVDTAVASPLECAAVLSNSRLVRGWLDAVEAGATSRLTEHHAAGQSAPPADTHTKCGGVSAAEGRRKERRSKTINDAPHFGDALAGGGIGAEHIDQLAAATARLDDTVKAALLGEQDDLLEAARSQTPEKFGQTVRDRARTLEADHGIERNKQQRKQTFLSHKVNHETGMHEGRFAFHPELGSRIFSAIDRQLLKNIKAGTARGEPEFVDRTFDYTQQAAVALGDIVTKATSTAPTPATAHTHDGHDGHDGSATSDHPSRATEQHDDASDDTPIGDSDGDGDTRVRDAGHSTGDGCDDFEAGECRGIEADITVIVDYQTAITGGFHDHSVCETSDGAVLPPASVQRLLCNGRVTPVIMDANGNPFNLGRSVRHANRHQRRALRAIYRSCGFPGCDVGFWKCEIHHILPWELGGTTDLANMLPICSRHHHVIHEGGWQLHLAPDRTLTITQPNGQVYGTATPDMKSQRGNPNDVSHVDKFEHPVEPDPPHEERPRARGPVQSDVGCEQMDLLAG